MDVFSKYFRRLLQNNASQIFSGSGQAGDPTGSYQLLVSEVQKIRLDPKQAQMIAESLDTSEGEIFRNFDVSTFMEHFQLDAVAKTMLALELKTAAKSDLRTKAEAILTNNFQNLLKTIMNPTSDSGDDLAPSYLRALLDRLLQDPPRIWDEAQKMNLQYAVQQRYEKLQIAVPSEISATMHLSELVGPTNPLVRLVQHAGPRSTSTLDLCRDMLASAETRDINYTQVANVLLFMVISHNGQAYNPSNFVAALREHRSGKRLDWQDVVHGFDRENLSVTKTQFLALYTALLPLAQEYENFDIQLLWGGQWAHEETQLSFVVAFLSCSPEEINASTIPRLRKTFTMEDFDDASEDVKARAAEASKHPLVSYDAVKALFTMIFQSQEHYKRATMLGIPETVINPHTDYFVVSTAAVPQPWGPIQEQAFKQLWMPFLKKRLPGYSFVFHGLWKRDQAALSTRLQEAYSFNPLDIQYIDEHAQEHGWLEFLTALNVPMSLDLAAYAHGRDSWDIESWLQQTYQNLPDIFPRALLHFLEERSSLDQQVLRNPEAIQSTIPLTVKTIFALLNFLQELIPDDNIIPLLRQCIAAYPRIVNYGEGFDEIIDANGKNGNALAPEADAQMQEHFKKLYNKESDVREIVEALRRYRQSEDPTQQELFSCMIAGLFDEYHCFSEYPPEALATTAVLFGSIINFGILSNISLRAAMAMVLEAVHADTDSNMFKFGVEALLHFKGRLSEWPRFCQELLQIRGLQTTEIWPIATDVVRNSMQAGIESTPGDQIRAGADGPNHHVLANGDGEEIGTGEPPYPEFTCLAPNPPLRPDLYEEPNEEVKDTVLFILNNVSERNITEKFKDLQEILQDKHHQWFAAYLVEERAKLQPNFQQLYLDMLELFGDGTLWAEVLRETYVSSIRMLNSKVTLDSSTERGHLKNLGSWLGALTLARNKPIKFKNISFRDLLIEAYQTARLVPVVPFICKVLVQAANSKVFKPPNPWTVEILTILVELYHHADMKLNLKFEVEVLCKGLDVDFKSLEPSTAIRDTITQSMEEEYLTGMSEVNDGFGDMSLGLARSRTQLSQAQIASRIPDISGRLYYPALSTPGVDIDEVNRALANAAQGAISEIIFPVVERSVTIAAISTRELVVKDYATEPDEVKFRNAAHNLVKNLAGSLAHVTCREPLRMAMTNNIRMLSRNLSNDGLPEGIILMFVNDNIDAVCKVVEENAEEQSIAEIDRRIADDIAARQNHKNAHRDEPFVYPPVSKWASCIPEPFKPTIGGLKPEQLAIYEDFSPARAIAGPLQTPVAENRPAPDMASDQYPPIPNITTPAGEPAILRQGNQRLLQPIHTLPGTSGQGQLNGYMEPFTPQDRVADTFSDLLRVTKSAPEEHIQDLGADSATRDVFQRILLLVESVAPGPQRDSMCLLLLHRITQALYGEADRRLEVDVLVQLLLQVSNFSAQVGKQLNMWLAQVDDERIFNPLVTPSLLTVNLLSISRLDTLLETAIRDRKPYALDFLDRALDELLLSRDALALRTDLIKAIEGLVYWIKTEPDSPEAEQARAIIKRLELAPADPSSSQPVAKTVEYECIFDAWVHLLGSKPIQTTIAAFVYQLYTKEILKDKPAEALFFRTCIETVVAAFEEQQAPYGVVLDIAYVPVDALARLIVSLVVYQGEDEGAVKANKASYLDSVLCTVILNQLHHHQTRGEHASQKVFYRLYSSILCYLMDEAGPLAGFLGDIMTAFGKALLALQPAILPGFAFGWLALVSHRLFMPALLKSTDPVQCDLYAQLMALLLKYTGEITKPLDVTQPVKQYYNAVLRLLLVLHHDFPEFTTEYHMALTDAIPTRLTQLRNVVLSAYPSSMAELPDPFNTTLKVDRIEEIRRQPIIREDVQAILKTAGIEKAVQNLLTTTEPNSDDFQLICQTLSTPKASVPGFAVSANADIETIHALILHVVMQATLAVGTKDATYNKNTSHAQLLQTLARELHSEARYYLLGAMITQLRYPNSHTHYCSYAILDIFGQPREDPLAVEIQEDITRILLERLTVHRPHPWGLLVLMLELVKNKFYNFWDLPFVKTHPEVGFYFKKALLIKFGGLKVTG